MIKNILFDFGGVLLNLDETLTHNELTKLLDPEKCIDINENAIYPFERGEISEESFFNRLQRRSTQIFQADLYYQIWNLMLLDFPRQRLDMLIRLRNNYKLYLLSNTNLTHYRAVQRIIKRDLSIENLNVYFDQAYYSHIIHFRKPDREAFDFVCTSANILPSETLFIDDKIEHVKAAKEIGFKVYHHKPSEDISEIIDSLLAHNQDE